MAQALSGNVSINLALTLAEAMGLAPAVAPVAYKVSNDVANGTGAGKANQMWSSSARSIALSSSESLDLSGALTDAFGNSIVFTKIKGILIKAAAANTNNVLVGGAAANAFVNWVGDATDIIVIKPGGTFLLLAPDSGGYAVTAGTGDLLKIANSSSGSAVVYDIVIFGEAS